MRFPRILMNAADASPGSGQPAPAPAPAAPAVPEPSPPAQQPAPAQGAVDVAAITRQVTDGVFASLRRAGVLTSARPTAPVPTGVAPGDAPAAPQQSSPPPQQPVDPMHRLMQLRALDRARERAGLGAIGDRALALIERAYIDEAPPDADAWVADIATSMGIRAAAASAPTTAATPTTIATPNAAPAATPTTAPALVQPANVLPVSDRGSPPPPTRPLEERSLYEMSDADRQEYLSRHGSAKYHQKLIADSKGRRSLGG